MHRMSMLQSMRWAAPLSGSSHVGGGLAASVGRVLRLTPTQQAAVEEVLSGMLFGRALPGGVGKKAPGQKGELPADATSSGGGGRGTGQGGPDVPEGGPAWLAAVTLGLVAALVGMGYLGRNSPRGKEITWQEFRNNYLAKGLVDRLEVVNKEHVQVYLAAPAAAAENQAAMQAAGAGDSGDAYASGAPDAYGTGGGGAGRPRASSGPAAAASGPSVFFRIGSVDTFERQLEEAQLDMRIPPSRFAAVKHISATEVGDVVKSLLPVALLVGLLMFMSSRVGGSMGGGGPGGINRVFSIGKASPKVSKDLKVKVSFKDVAGVDEAKAEVMEFVEFLKDPAKFTRVGAKIPKGALLVGPPGTGKTLLAKAVAGEADKPFFSMSGSDFIEMFVGVGPSRVRDLFQQARDSAPCIVFIDEIDAVARARGKGGMAGGNDERENTLNQLLVEMDGFSSTEGVVVLAGTNRVDILDKAILRPGRFDRQITVDKPDIAGRRAIFRVHLNNIPLKGSVSSYAQRLAALTPGFVGADIANICNEAAIVAARRGKEQVDMLDFDAAVDRVIGGLEKRNALMTPEEKKTVAYHEAGHAVAGWFLEHADPLLKVTIVPRGSGALGFAQYLPKEVTLFTKEALVDRICMALGGRAAEEVFFGKITTGASDDLDRVTQMAYGMVTVYGMSDAVGQLAFPPKEETQFTKPYSDVTASKIDTEVRGIVDSCYARTVDLLKEKREVMKQLAEVLLEKETINSHDLVQVLGPRPFPVNESLAQYLDTSWVAEEAARTDAAAGPSGGAAEER